MTYDELKQKLALDRLMETGVGLVSEKTYNDITELFTKLPEKDIQNIEVMGIRLIKNPFIPDGEIWPFERWDLSPKLKREFPQETHEPHPDAYKK